MFGRRVVFCWRMKNRLSINRQFGLPRSEIGKKRFSNTFVSMFLKEKKISNGFKIESKGFWTLLCLDI